VREKGDSQFRALHLPKLKIVCKDLLITVAKVIPRRVDELPSLVLVEGR
jgi:hypothetical protein